jgi:DNA topoisomerase-1
MKLFVVESPHKAKTIGSFLNKGNVKEWSIVATKGHIRDLPTKEYGVEKIGTEYHGKEIYISNEKKEIIEKIAELA